MGYEFGDPVSIQVNGEWHGGHYVEPTKDKDFPHRVTFKAGKKRRFMDRKADQIKPELRVKAFGRGDRVRFLDFPHRGRSGTVTGMHADDASLCYVLVDGDEPSDSIEMKRMEDIEPLPPGASGRERIMSHSVGYEVFPENGDEVRIKDSKAVGMIESRDCIGPDTVRVYLPEIKDFQEVDYSNLEILRHWEDHHQETMTLAPAESEESAKPANVGRWRFPEPGDVVRVIIGGMVTEEGVVKEFRPGLLPVVVQFPSRGDSRLSATNLELIRLHDAPAEDPAPPLSAATVNGLYDYTGFDWIKVKAFRPIEGEKCQEMLQRHLDHHKIETAFLIAEVRKLAGELNRRIKAERMAEPAEPEIERKRRLHIRDGLCIALQLLEWEQASAEQKSAALALIRAAIKGGCDV